MIMSLGKGFGWVAGGILALVVAIPTCSVIFRGASEGIKDSLGEGTFEEGYIRGAKESIKNTAGALVGEGFEIPSLPSADECNRETLEGCDFSDFEEGDDNSFENIEP